MIFTIFRGLLHQRVVISLKKTPLAWYISRMIGRDYLLNYILNQCDQFPITLIVGPRQCGKTTIARQIASLADSHYFDLEDPDTPLDKDIAKLVLSDKSGLVVIDEIQREPHLFELLRVLADRRPNPAKFLILGSASPTIIKGVSETLAGRVSYVEMSGFNLTEVAVSEWEKLWIRGAYPDSFLCSSDAKSENWKKQFVRTFLERDIPQLGIRIPSTSLRRFWTMVAHFHGQIWNAAEFARSLGTKEDTARKYLDLLSGAFMIRQLMPFSINIGKRLIKSPKIYLRDTGLLHSLLNLTTKLEVQSHPKLGFSFEGFAIDQIIQITDSTDNAYFYKTHAGAELDLYIEKQNKRIGFEFKYESRPRTTKSMHTVLADLNLDRLYVIYPGERSYPLAENIHVLPIKRISEFQKKLLI